MEEKLVRIFFPAMALLAGSLFVGGVCATAVEEAAKQVRERSPEMAAMEAVAMNDSRLLSVPFCGGMTPGFDFRAYRGPKLTENDLGLSCAALLGESNMKALQELEAWVRRYNAQLFKELNRRE